MYQAQLFNEEAAKSGGSKLQPGIHTNVGLIGVEQGEDYYDVLFEKEGLRANVRLWEPKGNFPNQGETEEQAKERERRANIDYLVHIMNLVIGLEASNKVQAATYEEFMRKAATLVNSKASQKRFNIKISKDKKGYGKMSSYRSNIELYTPGQEPGIKLTAKELAALSAEESPAEKKDTNLPF